MGLPVVLDTYSRIYGDLFDMHDYIDDPKGFQAVFGNPAGAGRTIFATDSEVFDHEIVDGNRKRAALIPRGINGTLQSLKGTKAPKARWVSRVFPLSEEISEITAGMLNKRLPGEPVFRPFSKFQRKQILAQKLHKEQVKRTVRLFESLAAQSFLTGKQDSIIGTSDPDEQYDFFRDPALNAPASAVWNAGTPDIFGDIDDRCDLIRQKSNLEPRAAFVDGGTLNAMLNDSTFQKIADNRRFQDVIQIGGVNAVPTSMLRFTQNGWKLRGRLMTPRGYELYLFTNNDGYHDDAGNFVKYLPENPGYFIPFAPEARFDRWFGPSEVLEGARRDRFYAEEFGISPVALPPSIIENRSNVILPQMFYHDAFPSEDEKGLVLRTQAAPVFAPVHTNAVGPISNTLVAV